MTSKNKSPKTANTKESTVHLQNRVLEIYRDIPNFSHVARELDLSIAYTRKLYKNALKAIVVENVEDLRKVEVARLDKLHEKAMQVLEAFHPLINSGQVVRDVVEDEYGRPIIDPETAENVTVRLEDQGPLLQAIDRLVKIADRRAKLLGLDKPTKTAFTDPTGEKEAQFIQYYIPENNRSDED
jgi:hypothetical protein